MSTTQNEMSGTQKFVLELVKLGITAGSIFGIFCLADKALDQGRTVDAEASPTSCKLSCGTPSVQPVA